MDGVNGALTRARVILGGRGGTQKSLIQGGSAPRYNPYPFIHNFDRKGTPFIYFPLTNGTPFTYLLKNTASLLMQLMNDIRGKQYY